MRLYFTRKMRYAVSCQERNAYILNKYPKLSETFIRQEILELVRSGYEMQLFSLFKPTEQENGKINWDDNLKIHYLMPGIRPKKIIIAHLYFIIRAPWNYFKSFIFAWKVRSEPSPVKLLANLFKTMSNPNGTDKEHRQEIVLHFLLAPVFALIVKDHKVTHIHAHFADAATSFAMLIANLLKIQFSFTAHAYDIFTIQANIEQKISKAAFIITCTRYNKKYWLEKYPWLDSGKIHVVYHGINWRRFTREKIPAPDKPIIITVARLVPKKGLAYLLRACLLLKQRGISFECKIIGDGPERARLEVLCKLQRLSDVVSFLGTIPPGEIKTHLERATVFALPCIVEESGDRDGIPNVIAEAMAMELPIVSTTVSGIPELVVDGDHGYLLEPGDFETLADKLMLLFADPEKCRKMGMAGRARVQQVFNVDNCLKQLVEVFEEKLR